MSFIDDSKSNEGDSYVKRQAKAQSIGSTTRRVLDRGRFGLAFACLVALCAFLGSSAPAYAGKVQGFGVLGTGVAGAGTGQISTIPKGVAVNATGAGGVTAGDVYVNDAGNNRVSQFSATGTFIRSFGQDVVASGPDSAIEVQRVTVNATAGTFRLTFGTTGTKTTGATGTGNLTESSTTVEGVVTSTGNFIQGEAITGAGIPAGTTIASVGAGTLTLSQAATATGSSVALTADLPYNASASVVQSALNALTTVSTGGGSVAVSGGPGDGTGSTPYVVTFNGGPLKGVDAAQMTGANGFLPLSGGTGTGANEVKVITSLAGGNGFEICNVAVNPTDVCKIGVASGAAGGLAVTQGIAVDQATGNVFVTNDGAAGNAGKRINVYSATGQFQGAFGWKVNLAAPKEELQFCTFATGCAAGASGGGAGQFAALAGQSNQGSSPTVNPVNGHLLVPEPGNRRISEFSLTLNGSKEVTGVSFVKAFGGDVVPRIDEIQTVTLTGATGGTFALGFGGDNTNATATGDIEVGSKEISNYKPGSVGFVRGEEVSGPGIPAGTRITAVTFDSVTLNAAATATATGASFSAALPYNAEAEAVQAALRAMPSIGEANVNVTGPTGGPFTVNFGAESGNLFSGIKIGKFAGQDVEQLSGDASGLTGTTPAVGIATNQNGANGTNTGFETCTAATTCKVGAEGGNGANGVFAAATPDSIAVDSAGRIYVATGQRSGGSCESSCGVVRFDSSGQNPQPFAPAVLSPPPGASPLAVTAKFVAIDPANDHVFVVKKDGEFNARLYELTSSGTLIEISPPGDTGFAIASTATTFGPLGFALGTGGRAYYSQQGPGNVKILGTPPAPKATIEPAGGVTESSATLSGIAQPSAPGIEGGFPTFAYFEYSADGVTWESTDPVAIGTGTGSGSPNSCPTGNPPTCQVTKTVTGLSPGQGYAARLVVTNGTATTSTTTSFETSSQKPVVSGMSATSVTQNGATINGLVNPNNRSTTYHFEWGTDTSYGNRIPADYEVVAGSGGQPVKASANLSGLAANTTYHFRIVATSPEGTTVGPDGALTTLNSANLPNNRQIELVSPANKQPAGSVKYFIPGQIMIHSAEDGESVGFPILNGTEESTAGGELIYAGHRESTGWTSSQLTPESMIPNPRAEVATAGFIRYLEPETLNCSLIETHNPLTEDTPQTDVENGVYNLYRRMSNGEYTLITKQVPLNPTAFQIGKYFEVAGTTPDCSKIFFRATGSSFQPGYKYFPGDSGLYEWDNGTLRDAGLRPDGTVPPNAPVGPEVATHESSVSPSGRFFFTATSNAGKDSGKNAVYVRKSPTETVNASQPVTATTSTGANLETATADGSHVYFRANYGLTPSSSTGPNETCTSTIDNEKLNNVACDLYDYNVETGQLTNISADTNPADTKGSVTQGVVAVSDDGSTVYFAARGQLVPGEGPTYKQNLQGVGFTSVYRWHEGDLDYVARLNASDLASVSQNNRQGSLIRNFENWVAQTTEDGRLLLFSSRANLTGTNSEETPQAYLFSAEDDSLSCLSCPNDGSAPSDQRQNGVEEIITREALNAFGTDNYHPRSLSEDGRVLFNSGEDLAPGGVEGQPNVYEWFRGQVSFLTTGEVKFQDLGGPNGRDVFVTSYSRLVPEDFDFAADLYDFRAGGGFPAPPEPSPACDPAADQCQGTPSEPPAAPTPNTSNAVGPGNPPVSEPPKKKKKKHKKKHKKQKKHTKKASKRAATTNGGGAK